MPRIKTLCGTVASGKHLKADKIYTVSESDAMILFRMGKAVPYGEPTQDVDNREKDLKIMERSDDSKVDESDSEEKTE